MRACEAHRRKHAETLNGTAVAATLKGALAATLRTHSQHTLSTPEWRNRYVVLAGVLLALDECSSEGLRVGKDQRSSVLRRSMRMLMLLCGRSKNGTNVQGRASPLPVRLRGHSAVGSCS